MSNLAIIPLRQGSRRLPGKNIRDFFGRPLVAYTLEYAKKSGCFDEIMVSTDSPEIADICRDFGGVVPFLRPPELATDTAQLVDVVRHVLQTYASRGTSFDNFCLLWATAPMRTDEDIRQAHAMLDEETEAVVGVTTYEISVFSGFQMDTQHCLAPLFPGKLRLPSSQQPPVCAVNSSLCWVRVLAFEQHNTWLPPRLKGYLMPRRFSVDIDTQDDWELAEYYYRKYFLQR
jgi:CMP-N-acetylneuraminic acid synthetase